MKSNKNDHLNLVKLSNYNNLKDCFLYMFPIINKSYDNTPNHRHMYTNKYCVCTA